MSEKENKKEAKEEEETKENKNIFEVQGILDYRVRRRLGKVSPFFKRKEIYSMREKLYLFLYFFRKCMNIWFVGKGMKIPVKTRGNREGICCLDQSNS